MRLNVNYEFSQLNSLCIHVYSHSYSFGFSLVSRDRLVFFIFIHFFTMFLFHTLLLRAHISHPIYDLHISLVDTLFSQLFIPKYTTTTRTDMSERGRTGNSSANSTDWTAATPCNPTTSLKRSGELHTICTKQMFTPTTVAPIPLAPGAVLSSFLACRKYYDDQFRKAERSTRELYNAFNRSMSDWQQVVTNLEAKEAQTASELARTKQELVDKQACIRIGIGELAEFKIANKRLKVELEEAREITRTHASELQQVTAEKEQLRRKLVEARAKSDELDQRTTANSNLRVIEIALTSKLDDSNKLTRDQEVEIKELGQALTHSRSACEQHEAQQQRYNHEIEVLEGELLNSRLDNGALEKRLEQQHALAAQLQQQLDSQEERQNARLGRLVVANDELVMNLRMELESLRNKLQPVHEVIDTTESELVVIQEQPASTTQTQLEVTEEREESGSDGQSYFIITDEEELGAN